MRPLITGTVACSASSSMSLCAKRRAMITSLYRLRHRATSLRRRNGAAGEGRRKRAARSAERGGRPSSRGLPAPSGSPPGKAGSERCGILGPRLGEGSPDLLALPKLDIVGAKVASGAAELREPLRSRTEKHRAAMRSQGRQSLRPERARGGPVGHCLMNGAAAQHVKVWEQPRLRPRSAQGPLKCLTRALPHL